MVSSVAAQFERLVLNYKSPPRLFVSSMVMNHFDLASERFSELYIDCSHVEDDELSCRYHDPITINHWSIFTLAISYAV